MEADNLDAVTGGSPRTDLVASEVKLLGAGAPAIETTFDYGLVSNSGMRRLSVVWMQTAQDRESAEQLGPGDEMKALRTVSYTSAGLLEYAQDPDGSLTHTLYDPATGAPAQVTRNAAGGSSPLTPFLPDRSSDGGSLVTTTKVDLLGRPIEQTDEIGRTTTIEYGLAPARRHSDPVGSPLLSNIEDTRLPYLHVVTTPHGFVDADGATRHVGPETQEWGNAAFNTIQTSAFVAGAPAPEERSRTLHTYALSGKLIETRVWHDLEDEEGGSYATTFQYDQLGRESGVTDPNGETLRRVFDARDRVIERYRGVGASEELLERIYYDYPLTSDEAPQQGVGEGNATLVERWLSDTEVRRTVTVFDWRNRARLTYIAQDTSAAIVDASALSQSDNGAYSATIFDDLDRPIEQAAISGGDMTALALALSEDTLASFSDYLAGTPSAAQPLVETISEIAYGDRGLPYRTTTYSYPNGYGAGVAHRSRTWYDENGRALASADERGPVTKTEYDGLGRVKRSAVTDGRSNRAPVPSFVAATAIDSSADNVYELTRPLYLAGLQVRTESSSRAHDASQAGLGENAITMYTDVVYDGGGRPVAQVGHGTGTSGFAAGAAPPPLALLSTSPDITDPGTIVTRLRYDALGRNHETVDALGRIARTYFDDLDRVVGIVENVRDGTSGDPIALAVDAQGRRYIENRPIGEAPDENRATTMAYDGAGNIIRRSAHQPDGALFGRRQITEYIYDRENRSTGVPSVVNEFDNPPLSNNLLYEIRYPRPDEGTPSGSFGGGDTVLFAHNRAGEQITQLDQDSVLRTQRRDPSGRILNETAWSAVTPTPFDETARAIVTDYDRFGRVASARMHEVWGVDGISSVVNEMAYTRDALGRVTTITHRPTGSPALSWDVGYEYEPFTGAFPVSRLAAITYPTATAEGPTRVGYAYGAAGSSDDFLSRISGFEWPNDILGAQSAAHEYVGLNRRVVTSYASGGALALRRDRHTDPDTGAATPGAYMGLDRFGRVARNVWSVGALDPLSRPALLDVAYAYDDAGNILSRRDARVGVTPPAADEFYAYDGLDRLTASSRGSAAAPALRSERWALDHQGNWAEHSLDANGDGALDAQDLSTRAHNATNEIVSTVDGAGVSQAFVHDQRGAIMAEPLAPALDASGNVVQERRRLYTRDMFGRLARIEAQSRPDSASPWSNPTPVAEYTYYAGNQLATRRADQDGDGGLETTTVYVYDADWNLLEEIEFVDEAAQAATSADLVRQHIWDPVSSNELVQARSMLRDGGGYTIPVPVWAATDRRRDVVAMHVNLFGTLGLARARYAPYGQPEPVLVGDLNGDGALTDDDRAHLAALLAASPSGAIAMGDAAWAPDADLNFDGVINGVDANLLSNLVNQGGVSEPGAPWGQEAGGFLRGLSIGYAGMMYDRQAGAYLMRNRWHSPTLGRFLSRDPAGYVDGMSLYAYVTGNPLKYWDPFGLIGCVIDRIDESDPRYFWDHETGQVYHVADVYRRGWLGLGPERYQGTKRIYDPGLDKGDIDGSGGLTHRKDFDAGIIETGGMNREMMNRAHQALAGEANGAVLGAAAAPILGKVAGKAIGKAAGQADEAAGQRAKIRNAHLAGKAHPKSGIPFDNDGFPDFSSVTRTQVKIKQTGSHRVDIRASNEAAGFSETPDGFTWHHHQDGTTMQLVPSDIHQQTGHTGGVALGKQQQK